jgi:hypothetical protein
LACIKATSDLCPLIYREREREEGGTERGGAGGERLLYETQREALGSLIVRHIQAIAIHGKIGTLHTLLVLSLTCFLKCARLSSLRIIKMYFEGFFIVLGWLGSMRHPGPTPPMDKGVPSEGSSVIKDLSWNFPNLYERRKGGGNEGRRRKGGRKGGRNAGRKGRMRGRKRWREGEREGEEEEYLGV